MTLKQFFQLAGGLLVGFLFYSLPILGIIKWPFAILSAILGIALAFMPLQERPLEKWIFAFFKAIYTPTEFLWKKTAVPVKFFQDEPADAIATLSDKLISTPATKLETNEQGFMSKISGIFAGFKIPQVQTTIPSITVDTPAAPVVNPTPPVRDEIKIPETAPIRIVQPGSPRMVVEESAPVVPITTQPVAPVIAGNEMISTKQAIFSVDAAPPSPPIAANVVVGQVVDQERKIVEGAIMEIRDASGRPIRALRSNKLGHFITVTPLDNGKYDIIAEKEGCEFTPVTFEARGAAIPPILVECKRLPVVENFMVDRPIVKAYTPALSPNFQ